VLRELVDNADGGRGMVATRVALLGGETLFSGDRSIDSLKPLVSRLGGPFDAPQAPPPPHRPVVDLDPPAGFAGRARKAVGVPDSVNPSLLRAVLRESQGLPPIDGLSEMTVGYESVDATVDKLFAHSEMSGSVFGILSGDYGTGKTHLLLHLAARAIADRRPVLRLALERLDVDLGDPPRHFGRLLEGSTLPFPGRPSMSDHLLGWTRDEQKLGRVERALSAIAAEEGDAAQSARRAIERAGLAPNRASALESYLSGSDLLDRKATAAARESAYGRLLLWIELLSRVDKAKGPVLLLDEAENLYRGGSSRSERRTALRSLSFYCSGALPNACVILAITPDALTELRDEATELLRDVAEQRTVLPWEEASMFERRLRTTKPIRVPALRPEHLTELAERARTVHGKVRGKIHDAGFEAFVDDLTRTKKTAREVLRRVVDRLEGIWWSTRTG
jgi:hypothetical protein